MAVVWGRAIWYFHSLSALAYAPAWAIDPLGGTLFASLAVDICLPSVCHVPGNVPEAHILLELGAAEDKNRLA